MKRKRRKEKQVLTSNQICCIDFFATLALEQISKTTKLSPRIHFPQREPVQKQVTCVQRHKHIPITYTHLSEQILSWKEQAEKKLALIREPSATTRFPFPKRLEFLSKSQKLMSCSHSTTAAQLGRAHACTLP